MAQKVIQSHTCDDCEDHEDYDVPAPHQHVLSINGGPFKQLDFCGPSDRAVMRRVIELYEKRGAELPLPPQEPRSIEPQVVPEERQAAEEVPPPPTAKKSPPKKAAVRPSPKQSSPKAPAKKTPAKSPKPKIWCPLPHKSQHGAGMRVAYDDRNSHADMCHHGAKLWDITWEDPDGIITVYCTSHAECMAKGIGFMEERGLRIHVRTSPLQRIDLNEGPSE